MTEYIPTECPYCYWWVPEGMEYMMGDHIQQCIEGNWLSDSTLNYDPK